MKQCWHAKLFIEHTPALTGLVDIISSKFKSEVVAHKIMTSQKKSLVTTLKKHCKSSFIKHF